MPACCFLQLCHSNAEAMRATCPQEGMPSSRNYSETGGGMSQSG